MNTTRDHTKVKAAAQRCLADLAMLNGLITTQQVAIAIGFAEGLLDELIEACDSGEDAPMVGHRAQKMFAEAA